MFFVLKYNFEMYSYIIRVPRLHRAALCWCVLVIALLIDTPANGAMEALRAQLEEGASSSPTQFVGARGLDAATLRGFYAARGFQPLWIKGRTANTKASVLLAALGDAASEGLDPASYQVTAASTTMNEAELTQFELGLSMMLVRYATDLSIGRFSPQSKLPEQHIVPKPLDPLAILGGAAETDESGFASYLRSFAPPHRAYVGLRTALARYRALGSAGGWPVLADGPALKPGMADERVAQLRRQLEARGDLMVALDHEPPNPIMPRSDLTAASLVAGPAPPAPSTVDVRHHYDPALQMAVERFQRRHGLEVDGIVGRATRAALNVPVQDRIDQITLNMERWRWMPRDLGATHVVVNMAGFELDLVEDRRPVLSMRVVVGKPYQSTPVFSNTITYLEFNPYWNVPHNIASKELLPLIQRDPGYLTDRGIGVYTSWGAEAVELDPWTIDWWAITPRTFPFRLRQDPGRDNPLGRVKFMFPNRFAVYLHDTSSPSLFQRAVRTFSHGCIRIEKPAELAAHLLRHNPGWDLARVQSTMVGRTRRIATLKRPVPVHLIYATAWSDDDGTVQFRNDIYGRDSLLSKVLFPELR